MALKTGSLKLEAPVDRVFDYFAVPRNLIMANRAGPVIERSMPPTGPGSWAVMKFDQLRLRVEYETWDRPGKIAGVVRYSGFGSGNRVDTFSYEMRAEADGTRLDYSIAGGPSVPLSLIGDWLWRRYWRNVERRIKAGLT